MGEPESLAVEEDLEKHIRRHAVDRLVMLSDGVFAIAVTLAALEIHIPNAPTFRAVIADLGIPLLAYVISFQVIAVFWVSNRDLFARVRYVDRVLTGLVLAILCLTALIPSSIRVAGPSAGNLGGAFEFYALIMTLTGTLNCLIWLYASSRHGIMRNDVSRGYRWTRIAETATLPLIFGAIFAFPTVQVFKFIALATVVILLIRRPLLRLIIARAESSLGGRENVAGGTSALVSGNGARRDKPEDRGSGLKLTYIFPEQSAAQAWPMCPPPTKWRIRHGYGHSSSGASNPTDYRWWLVG